MLRQQKYKVVIQNAQSSPTPVPFQQLLILDLSDIVSRSEELLNLRFCADNGCQSPLYAWVESYNNDFSSVYVWVKIPYQIPANSQFPLYISKQSVIQYPFTGMAPQLLSGYDNGTNVFTNYWNFAGLSALPSPWEYVYGSSTATFTSTAIEFSSVSSPYFNAGITTSQSFNLTGYVADFYANFPQNPGGSDTEMIAAGLGSANTTSTCFIGSGGGFVNCSCSECAEIEENQGSGSDNNVNLWVNGTESSSTFTATYGVYHVFSIGVSSSATYYYIDYNLLQSLSAIASSVSLPLTIGSQRPPLYIAWIRIRALPPNGVMPSSDAFLGV